MEAARRGFSIKGKATLEKIGELARSFTNDEIFEAAVVSTTGAGGHFYPAFQQARSATKGPISIPVPSTAVVPILPLSTTAIAGYLVFLYNSQTGETGGYAGTSAGRPVSILKEAKDTMVEDLQLAGYGEKEARQYVEKGKWEGAPVRVVNNHLARVVRLNKIDKTPLYQVWDAYDTKRVYLTWTSNLGTDAENEWSEGLHGSCEHLAILAIGGVNNPSFEDTVR